MPEKMKSVCLLLVFLSPAISAAAGEKINWDKPAPELELFANLNYLDYLLGEEPDNATVQALNVIGYEAYLERNLLLVHPGNAGRSCVCAV